MTTMTTRRLGDSDLVVSDVGLGCNNFGRGGRATADLAGTDAVIGAAVDAGITLFDTADIYGSPPTTSESLMGEALGDRRDRIVLATKFGHSAFPAGDETADWGPKGGRRYVRAACEASLRRLRTDRIDLYQMHTPDPATPIGETLAALTELVEEGKVRYVGNSNFDADQVAEADRVARENGYVRFVSAQNDYSLLNRGAERDLVPTLLEHGLSLLPYFPLGNGLLTGKYSRATAPAGSRITDAKPEILEGADWDQLEAYREVCEDVGAPMAQVTFAWLLTRDGMGSVIAGATRPEQVAENAAAATLRLSGDAVTRIDEIFA